MVSSQTLLLAIAAGVTAAATTSIPANATVVTTTRVVSRFTTYCPEATHFTMGNKTWTVTEPTTLTITDCPCTMTEVCSTYVPVETETPCEEETQVMPVETPCVETTASMASPAVETITPTKEITEPVPVAAAAADFGARFGILAVAGLVAVAIAI